MVGRKKEIKEIKHLLNNFRIIAILGARQVGKTTLARYFKADYYFDLENPRNLVKLENPQLALEDLKGLIVIDEIQRKAELFPLLRYLVDNNPQQKYMILGSSSPDLIRQSSETLAGRIAFFYLNGFSIYDTGVQNWKRLWVRGGFPSSFLAEDETISNIWRENFITTFVEKDVPQLGITIPANTLRRFLMMLSHYHAQVVNYSEIASSFGMSDMTVRRYIEIFQSTFIIRVLQPWHVNLGKRLVKRPKIYLRDSGLFHTMMAIENIDQLTGQPRLGASWEGYALEQVCKSVGIRAENFFFWRTHTGAELDLFWQGKGKNWGVEFKYQDAPRLTRSMRIAIEDLQLHHLWVVYPGKENYLLDHNITVLPLSEIKEEWIYPV